MKSRKEIAASITERRARIALLSLFVFLSLVLTNIFRLSVLEYEKYKDKAFSEITTTSTLKAERGKIYDANMNLLAATNTTWRIFVFPKEIKRASVENNIDYANIIAEELARIFNFNVETLHKKIVNTSVLDVTVKQSATENEYRQVLNLIVEKNLGSMLSTEAQTSRYYPEKSLAAHVLGFSGSDNQGLFGLEYYYDEILKGKDGYYLYARDAGGNAMPDGYSSIVEPIDGYSLVTTLDSYVQSTLEGILETIRVTHKVTDRVSGIVMDTSTGAILGMATSSPFDPNDPFTLNDTFEEMLKESGYPEGSEEYKSLKNQLLQLMWSNKCLTETYEPGSTFKIITVAAALDSKSSSMNDIFSCKGYHTVGGWRIKCHKTTGHGSNFSLAYGLQMSCNPTMMTIAERMGAETFYKYVKAFGYLSKSGIDLPGEASTIFHNESDIGTTELATASFGQRFKVSIINHITAIATVANGGKSVVPYLVEKIIDSDGNIIKVHQGAEPTQIISEDVAREITRVLEEGVSGEGGAKNAYVDGYNVAAKTGTSQKFDIVDENGNSYLRIGSTVAYTKTNDSGIAVIIVVDEPQTTVKYGSTVAAPYVSSLLDKILPYLNFERHSKLDTFTTGNYTGLSVQEAEKIIGSSIEYQIIGNGSVILHQTPPPNVDCTVGLSKITLYTTNDEIDTVSVPNVVGMSIFNANKLLSSLGFTIHLEGVKDINSSCLSIIEQSLVSGERVKRGAIIVIKAYRTDFED